MGGVGGPRTPRLYRGTRGGVVSQPQERVLGGSQLPSVTRRPRFGSKPARGGHWHGASLRQSPVHEGYEGLRGLARRPVNEVGEQQPEEAVALVGCAVGD